MSSDPAGNEQQQDEHQQDEHQDEHQDEQQGEDAAEGREGDSSESSESSASLGSGENADPEDADPDFPGVKDFSREGDKIKAPEGEFSADDKGFDGSTVDEILEDRAERLDLDNRPENTEVTNAGREFDDRKGMFKDEEGYEEAEEVFDPDAV